MAIQDNEKYPVLTDLINEVNQVKSSVSEEENIRVTRETARINNENSRVNAEALRVTSFNKIKNDYETATMQNTDIEIVQARQGAANLNANLTKIKEQINSDILLSNKVTYVAHRGLSQLAPENTLPAYELASSVGFKFVETDIHVTSDGIWVVHHDETVDRMTNGTGYIKDLTLTQIKALNIDAGNRIAYYEGTKIPTLEEFLDMCIKFDLFPVLEIKGFNNNNDCVSLLNLLVKKQCIDRVIIASFDNWALLKIRDYNQRVILAPLWTVSQANIDFTKNLGRAIYSLNYSLTTQADIELIHNNGLKVFAWTVNDRTAADTYTKYGVDFIMTDILLGGVM